jgi:hypothetical protein
MTNDPRRSRAARVGPIHAAADGFIAAEPPSVLQQLRRSPYGPGNYERIIVTWGATPEAQALAAKRRVQLWDFRDLLRQIAAASNS